MKQSSMVLTLGMLMIAVLPIHSQISNTGDFVSPFVGAVSTSITPTKGVTLNYSSASVPFLITAENRDAQTSWVGAGWSFGTEAVEVDHHGTATMEDDEYFYIDGSGGRTPIMKDNAGVYRIQNYPYWKIALTVQEDTSGYIDYLVTGVTITRDDGSKYKYGDFRLGYGPNKANRCVFYSGDRVSEYLDTVRAGQICYRWDLAQVYNPYGILQLEYFYDQEQEAVLQAGVNRYYTRASYLFHVDDKRTGMMTAFTRANRSANEYQNTSVSTYKINRYETQYLDSIRVFSTQTAIVPIQLWNLDYQLVGSGVKTKRLLTSVTQLSMDYRAYPAYQFMYNSSKYQILDSLVTPEGGSYKIVIDSSKIGALTQSTQIASRIVDPYWGNLRSVATSGMTVASGSFVNRWIGDWLPATLDVPAGYYSRTDSPLVVKVSDQHVLLKWTYYTQGWLGLLDSQVVMVFDWREDTRTWNLGLVRKDKYLVANISPSGNHVGVFNVDINGSKTFGVITWNPSTSIWDTVGGSSIAVNYSPYSLFEMADDKAMFDVQYSGLYIYGWVRYTDNMSIFGPTLVTTAYGSNEEFSLKKSYIGHWQKNTGNIIAYHFIGNTIDTMNYGAYYGSARFAIFDEERMLVCTKTNDSVASIKTWYKDRDTFKSNSSITQTSIKWNSDYELKASINEDWLFVLNTKYRGGVDTSAKLFGYIYDRGTHAFTPAGNKFYNPDACGRPFAKSQLVLTGSHVILGASSSLVSCSPSSFTDAYLLDRTAPSSWTTAGTRVFTTVGDAYPPSDSSHIFPIMVGTNFIAVYDSSWGGVKAKHYHGTTKSWEDSVRVYRVSGVTTRDGMGGAFGPTFSYDSIPTFDPSLQYPGYGKFTKALSGAGSAKTWFKKSLSSPRVRGAIDSVKAFKEGDSVVVQRYVPKDTIVQNANKWYIYQYRKLADTTTLDSVTSITSYAYNDSNGQVNAIMKDLDLASEYSGVRDEVTRIKFAFQVESAMRASNMLVQVLEESTMAVGSNPPEILISKTRTDYDVSPFYPKRTKVWNGTGWDTTTTIVSRDTFGNVQETKNIDNVPTSVKYAYNKTLPIATFVNATNSQTVASIFDDRDSTAWISTHQSWLLKDGAYQQIDGTGQGGWDRPTKNSSATLDDGILEADLRFDASGNYRYAGISKYIDGYNFVRFELRKTDGTVMISARKANNMIYQSVAFTCNEYQWYHLKGEIDGTTARIYVDGVLYLTLTDNRVDLANGYIGLCTFGTVATFDNPRFYPLGATATTQSYDPLTYVQNASVNSNGTASFVSADGFMRRTQAYNADRKFISAQSYFYSRDTLPGTFSRTNPNLATTVTYTSETGYNDLRSSTGWTSAGNISFNVLYQGEVTARVGKIPGDSSGCIGGESSSSVGGGESGLLAAGLDAQRATAVPIPISSSGVEVLTGDTSYQSTPYVPVSGKQYLLDMNPSEGILLGGGEEASKEPSAVVDAGGGGGGGPCYPDDWGYIKKNAGLGEIVARLDFFTGTSTGSQRPLGFDASGYRFYVEYVPGSNAFKVYRRVNAGSDSLAYTFSMATSSNKWYTIEITKGAVRTVGKCYAWVFPRGGSRNYADYIAVSGFPMDWNTDVYTWSKVNYIYIANHYVGSFSQTTTYTDGLGRTRQSHSRNGGTAVEYDGLGRAYREWMPYQAMVAHRYDDSISTHVNSAYGSTTAYTQKSYKDDPLSRASQVIDVSQQSSDEITYFAYGSEVINGTRLAYTEQKHKKSTNAGNPWIVSREYRDRAGRVVRNSTYPDNNPSDNITPTQKYTFGGQVRVSTAPMGDSTTQRYSILGRLAYRVNPDEGTSKYIYDRAGRLRFMIDSVGLVANPDTILYWKYDTFGRVIEKGYFTGTWDSTSLQSSANSSPTYPTTPSTWSKQYTYDRISGNSSHLVDRLYSVVSNNDADATAEVEEYFSYDRWGNTVTVREKVIDYSTGVDTTSYIYDHIGSSTKIVYPASSFGAVSVAYQYDQLGRVDSMYIPGGIGLAKYTYTDQGSIFTERLNANPTGSRTRTYTFDLKGRLTGISSPLFTEKILYSSGGYSSNEGFYHGLIARDSIIYPYSGGPATIVAKYAYDDFGRLTIADHDILDTMDVGVGSPTVYDKNGNITQIKRGGTVYPYTYYTGMNRLKKVGTGSDYTYDRTGNAMNSPAPTSLQYLRYDPFTMMTMCEKRVAGDSLSIQYRGDKERVLKTHTNGATIVKTRYIRGLNDYPLAEKISSGHERRYIYGPTGLVAIKDDWGWYYVMKDHLGSSRLSFDSSGSVRTTIDYNPYGRVGRSMVNTEVKYRFNGQEYDGELGDYIYNFRARNYDGSVGLFSATDPRGQTFSPYSIAGGNSISNIDRDGQVFADYQGYLAAQYQMYLASNQWLTTPGGVKAFRYLIYTLNNGDMVYRGIDDTWNDAIYISSGTSGSSSHYGSSSASVEVTNQDNILYIALKKTFRTEGVRSSRTNGPADLLPGEYHSTLTKHWTQALNTTGFDIKQNIAWAEAHRVDLNPFQDVAGLIRSTAKLLVWANKVRPGGVWDASPFKNPDLGNFNYGVTGTALGLDLETLGRAGGTVQFLTDIWKNDPSLGSKGTPIDFSGTYGDNPDDPYWYWVGQQYYLQVSGR
jgi:RHS repeat-associated protein